MRLRKQKETGQWVRQLFTKEDHLHVHKTLGGLALLSYVWRLSQAGATDMAFQTHPEWTAVTLLLHLFVNLSSFEFRIPAQRITTDGGRIWPEYRLHSLVFLSRALACIAVNWYEQHYQLKSNYLLNLFIVLGAIAAGDISSYAVGQNHSRSIRDLSAPASVKYYFSVMQFYATAVALFGLRRSSLFFYIALVVQVTAFLMTLRRKNLVSHEWNIVLYGALLAGGFAMGAYECVYFAAATGRDQHDYNMTAIFSLSLIACTASLWRMGPWPTWMDPLRNKYLVWTAMYYLLNRILRPVVENEGSGGIALSKETVQQLALGEFSVMVAYGIYKHFAQKGSDNY